ncbi:Regulating synaptic membrane exocytosis protein 2 [Gryllus bimaculatus]|nr:Regulating synaptic membrane exocytosis protein 2 [Gryllus bimaculatus]
MCDSATEDRFRDPARGVIWVCILCRKKQELLSKTGQWIKQGMSPGGDAIMRRIEADLHAVAPGPMSLGLGRDDLLMPAAGDKRPKLERAHSAAEKPHDRAAAGPRRLPPQENVPLLQRSGSALRRQYSQQEPGVASSGGGRRMSASDSGVDMLSPSQRGPGGGAGVRCGGAHLPVQRPRLPLRRHRAGEKTHSLTAGEPRRTTALQDGSSHHSHLPHSALFPSPPPAHGAPGLRQSRFPSQEFGRPLLPARKPFRYSTRSP